MKVEEFKTGDHSFDFVNSGRGHCFRFIAAVPRCENSDYFNLKNSLEATCLKTSRSLIILTLTKHWKSCEHNDFVSEFLTFLAAAFKFERNNRQLKMHLPHKVDSQALNVEFELILWYHIRKFLVAKSILYSYYVECSYEWIRHIV